MTQPYHQRDHSIRTGKILYTSKKEDRMDEERGRETWVMTKHPDGRRSLLTHTEIDDKPSVLRNSHINVAANYAPIDCYARLTLGDAFYGSGWFRFTDSFVECETYTVNEGRMSQRIDLDAPVPSFGAHAIQNDAWVLGCIDTSSPGVKELPPHYASSSDHRGATGPYLHPVSGKVNLIGTEEITVKAGTFEAFHWSFEDIEGLPVEHPPYHCWTTTDGDMIYLKGLVEGYMMTYYELVELTDSIL